MPGMAWLRQQQGNKSALRLVSLLLLTGFFVFLLAQHQLVFFYHDDWGMAVLDYAQHQSGFSGQDFPLSKAVAFLTNLYQNWTGRVSAFLLLIYAQKMGLEFIRVLQSLIILFVVVLAAKIAGKAAGNGVVISFFGGILLYLALPVYVCVGGIYWFTAASTYLWGLPFFFVGVYLLLDVRQMAWDAALVLAIAATFHEQIALAVLGFLLIYFFCSVPKQPRAIAAFGVRTLPFALLAAATVLAPGNWNRKSMNTEFYDSHSVVEIATDNLRSLSELLFWPRWDNVFVWAMAYSGSVLWLFAARARGWNLYVAFAFLGALALCFALLYEFDAKAAFSLSFIGVFTGVLAFAGSLTLNGRLVLAVHCAALCSLAPLIWAPTVAKRALIPFFVIEFVPVIFGVSLVVSSVPIILRGLAPVVFSFWALKNAVYLFDGYSANRDVNLVNDCILRAASYEYKIGEPVASVKLFKLKRPQFGQLMPYDRPLVGTWMKKFYRLPPETVLEWR